jgi:diguanylate cyclase (GGDEF)-like protein
MGELIQSCQTVKEACKILESYLPKLIPGQSGAVYLFDAGNNFLEAVAVWGDRSQNEEFFTLKECWALRRGQIHVSTSSNISLRCPHLGKEAENEYYPYICIPLTAQGETLGLLHSDLDAKYPTERQEALIQTIARWLSPAIANLKINENLHNLSILDSLTQLYNRRYMEELLEHELRRSARRNRHIGLIMLDIDYFKQFNDTYGHGVGDMVLQAISRYLQTSVRAEDFACRLGGDEFIVILPETTPSDTQKRGDILRQGVKDLTVDIPGVKLPQISVSVGVACYPEHGNDNEKLLQAVDQALYLAKQQGRGRVVMSG